MSLSESNPGRLTVRVSGDAAIGEAVDAARSFGAAHRLPGDELARLCIVVEELVTNLYEHGGLTQGDEVGLAFAIDLNGIRVSITHPGKAFDPWSAPQTAQRSERGGGAGVRLIRAWAQLVSYQSLDDGNHLELVVPSRPAM